MWMRARAILQSRRSCDFRKTRRDRERTRVQLLPRLRISAIITSVISTNVRSNVCNFGFRKVDSSSEKQRERHYLVFHISARDRSRMSFHEHFLPSPTYLARILSISSLLTSSFKMTAAKAIVQFSGRLIISQDRGKRKMNNRDENCPVKRIARIT